MPFIESQQPWRVSPPAYYSLKEARESGNSAYGLSDQYEQYVQKYNQFLESQRIEASRQQMLNQFNGQQSSGSYQIQHGYDQNTMQAVTVGPAIPVGLTPPYDAMQDAAAGYFGDQFFGWRAPVMQPRNILLPEPLPTPHDTYRYPTGPEVQQFSSLVSRYPPTKDETLQALSEWYVDQVINVLVKPGQFRPGVGGSSEEIWGPAGREREAWERIGRAAPEFEDSWGRMGMASTPATTTPPLLRKKPLRTPEMETHDPWDVLWSNSPKRSATLVLFVKDILSRMSIDATSVIAAVWFLHGLGLHEGDGSKGSELRETLRSLRMTDLEAVEKRVATMGLLLAGKWLDDNSYLSKSWTEVTAIPVQQISQMERAILADLHYALYIPLTSWADHVNKLYSALECKARDATEEIVHALIDTMVTAARDEELGDPTSLVVPPVDMSRRSSHDIAAEQAISRDWSSYIKSYQVEHQSPLREPMVDTEAEKNVSALVDEDMPEVEEEEEEDGWAIVDYDGAKPWLPPLADVRRSMSHSRSPDLAASRTWEWTQHANSSDTSIELRQDYNKPRYAHHRNSSGTSFDFTTPSPSVRVAKHSAEDDTITYPSINDNPIPSPYRESGYLEPGISVVKPPQSLSKHGFPQYKAPGHHQTMWATTARW